MFLIKDYVKGAWNKSLNAIFHENKNGLVWFHGDLVWYTGFSDGSYERTNSHMLVSFLKA